MNFQLAIGEQALVRHRRIERRIKKQTFNSEYSAPISF